MNTPIRDFHALTPVEEYTNIGGFSKMMFKRDDLYLPFEDAPRLGGGKVRQTIALFTQLRDTLNEHNGIITYSSVNSPQAVIVVKTAHSMGYHSAVSVGGALSIDEVVRRHKPIRECHKLGAEIYSVSKMGYNNVLHAKTKVIAEEKNYYIIQFGINIDDAPHALVDSIADQVQNMPDSLDTLIIPVGSGIQTGAILYGLHKYKKHVRNILAVQIAGYDRTKVINDILERMNCPIPEYKFILDKTYPYSKHIRYPVVNVDKYFDLNVVYESKALEYCVKHKNELDIDESGGVLYWVVGENNYLYS